MHLAGGTHRDESFQAPSRLRLRQYIWISFKEIDECRGGLASIPEIIFVSVPERRPTIGSLIVGSGITLVEMLIGERRVYL